MLKIERLNLRPTLVAVTVLLALYAAFRLWNVLQSIRESGMLPHLREPLIVFSAELAILLAVCLMLVRGIAFARWIASAYLSLWIGQLTLHLPLHLPVVLDAKPSIAGVFTMAAFSRRLLEFDSAMVLVSGLFTCGIWFEFMRRNRSLPIRITNTSNSNYEDARGVSETADPESKTSLNGAPSLAKFIFWFGLGYFGSLFAFAVFQHVANVFLGSTVSTISICFGAILASYKFAEVTARPFSASEYKKMIAASLLIHVTTQLLLAVTFAGARTSPALLVTVVLLAVLQGLVLVFMYSDWHLKLYARKT